MRLLFARRAKAKRTLVLAMFQQLELFAVLVVPYTAKDEMKGVMASTVKKKSTKTSERLSYRRGPERGCEFDDRIRSQAR